jgi:LSD1 subclass zinc finger protein
MAVATGPCPNCGSSIEFRAGSSLSLVCKYCKHVVVRTDRDLKNLGRIADVAFSDAALAPGDRGTFRGRSFSVEGRLVLQHPAGGTWEEYYAVFDGRNNAWISEAQGFWQVVTAAPIAAPPLQSLQPQMQVPLGQHGIFVVGERNEGTFLSGEGELPFAAAPGTKRLFVDLSAAGGGWASIDYGDGTAAPQVYVGVQTSFAEFQVTERGGDRPAAKIATQSIKCGSCGAPLPVLSPGAERAACVHCNAISDVKLQQVVARQGQAREKPSIELGRKGVLPVADARGVTGAEWTVLGYVERSTGAPMSDDWFGWQEYLLYNVQHGYRWLVFDEGMFYLITPLAAGVVDASRAPVFVRRNNIHYRQRNQQQARVDFVLGELYWKVEVGETVWAADYENGREIISSETTANEVSWSHGVVISTQVVTQAFGYMPKVSSYGEPAPAFGGFAPTGTGSASPALVIAIVVIVILVFGMAACGACVSDGDGSSGSSTSGGVRGVGGSSSGGFGGK